MIELSHRGVGFGGLVVLDIVVVGSAALMGKKAGTSFVGDVVVDIVVGESSLAGLAVRVFSSSMVIVVEEAAGRTLAVLALRCLPLVDLTTGPASASIVG